MPKITILAYYYHKKEEHHILKYLKDPIKTDSFIFGFIETNDIHFLKKEGILFDILPEAEISENKIPRRLQSKSAGRSFVYFQADERSGTTSSQKNYYLIKFKGPLFDAWKKQLEAAHVKLLENLQHNTYKVYTSEDVTFFQKFPFIAAARPFKTGDKDIIVRRSVLPVSDVFDLNIEANRVSIYDIRIQAGESAEALLHFLKESEVEILNADPHKVRVRLTDTEIFSTLSQRNEVYAIEEYIKPKLYNDKARLTLHIEEIKDGGIHAIVPYEGEGQIIGVADTGIDTDHPDFQGRIHKIVARGRSHDHSDPHGHGTHVSGSILGDGNASQGLIKGMAPKATLFFQSILDDQGGLGGLPLSLNELFQEAYEEGVRIHNNSWGALAESEYRFNSLEVDEYVYYHKDMLLVISAGNEGTAFQPRNSQAGFVDWLSLGSPATAKNALTVGASRSSRREGGFAALTYGMAWPDAYPHDPIKGAQISGDIEGIAGFSSRGPCGNESRIKPDVVAPGTDIASTKSALAPTLNFWGPYPRNRRYAFMGGTSMAAPIVTGFAALIREYFIKERSHAPSAALLKATIVNSTRKLTGKDALADYAVVPNFHQGFGCVDMQNALPNTLQPNLSLTFADTWQQPALQFTAMGQRFLFSIKVKEGLPLRVCLTWTDPPGRGLQNNLNLFLMHKARQFKWTGNEDIPRTITAFDRDNNVEIIRVDEPHAGEYLIAVQAANILFSPQDFALVVTGALNSPLTQL